MQKNRVQLTADFIQTYLVWQRVKAHQVDVPLPLGMRAQLTIDPKDLYFEGRTVVVPMRAQRGPAIELRFHEFSIHEGWLWFTADQLKLGLARLPVGTLLARLLQLALKKQVELERAGDRFGIHLDSLTVPRIGIAVTSFSILSGIDVEFVAQEPCADYMP